MSTEVHEEQDSRTSYITSTKEGCEHEYPVSEVQNMSPSDNHRIDIPESLNSVASNGNV